MHLTITGRNMEVTPALRQYAEEKIAKMEKYLHKITSAHIILSVEKYRHVAEVTINALGLTLKGQEETGDMYSSIDLVMDKIGIQAKKVKDRVVDKNKTGANNHAAPVPERSEAGQAKPRIISEAAFDPKPMTVDDATVALGETKDPLLVFLESRTGKVNVLYRRADGNFGLIET